MYIQILKAVNGNTKISEMETYCITYSKVEVKSKLKSKNINRIFQTMIKALSIIIISNFKSLETK